MLIKMLKDEEDNIRIKTIRCNLGHTFPRKQKYIDLEERYRFVLGAWYDNHHGIEFLSDLVILINY